LRYGDYKIEEKIPEIVLLEGIAVIRKKGKSDTKAIQTYNNSEWMSF